jgi:plastocyanin
MLHLDQLHRLDVGDAPERAVTDASTYLLGWSHGGWALVGAHWAPRSDLVPGHPNEWELLARFAPLSSSWGAAFDFGLTAAWNEAAGSLDGELAVGVPLGRAKLMGALRGLSDGFGQEDARWVFGLGAVVDVTEHVALAADVVRPFDLAEGETYGWGGAVQLAVPGTPHSLSLQAANTNSATLQGSSRGSGGTRFGFELTLAVSPDRLLGGEGARSGDPAERAGEADLVAGDTARIEIGDGGFGDPRVVVRPGTYVVWTVTGGEIHSVVSDDGSWESPFIAAPESFGRVFTEEGEHPYHCGLHPAEEAVLVVRLPPEPLP